MDQGPPRLGGEDPARRLRGGGGHPTGRRTREGSGPGRLDQGDEWLEQGAAEVAVVTLTAAGCHTVALAQDQMVAVLPAEHRLAARSSVSLKALGAEPFVLPTGGCEPIIAAAAARAGVSLNVAFEAREVATILAMVEGGLGVSVVPTLALPAEPGAHAVRPLDPPVPRLLGLAVRTLGDASPAARAFLEVAAPAVPGPG